eukprot:g33460.t1
MAPVESRQGRGGEYVSDGGISLKVAEMTTDGLLDVDAGGMVGKDKGIPIAVAEGERGCEGQSAGDGSDLVEGPVDSGAGESPIEEEGGYFGGFVVKVGIIRTYATETDKLGEWNRVFTGNRVQGCIIQITVGVGGFIVDISGQSIPRTRNRDVTEGNGGVRDGL